MPAAARAAGLPSLGIAPVRDRRSALSREAVGPRLRAVWLGVVREGERQTGDASFGEESAPELVRRDVRATLARSLAFRTVRDAPGPAPGLDHLLELELEELAGTARERWEFNLLRLGFVRFERAPAVGRARLRAVVHSTGGARLETSVERRVEVRTDDPREAALDALALADEDLALWLMEQLGGRDLFPARGVSVRVLDGCALGTERATALVGEASAIFERTAGIRLDPEVEAWVPGCAGSDGSRCLSAAREQVAPEGGFVLAIAPAHAQWLAQLAGRRSGLAVQLGDHAWLACPRAERPSVSTLAHEIGHLFGAVHSREPSSIMHPVTGFDGRFFDAQNAEILALTRMRPFGRALPGPMSRGLDALYARSRMAGPSQANVVREAVH